MGVAFYSHTDYPHTLLCTQASLLRGAWGPWRLSAPILMGCYRLYV